MHTGHLVGNLPSQFDFKRLIVGIRPGGAPIRAHHGSNTAPATTTGTQADKEDISTSAPTATPNPRRIIHPQQHVINGITQRMNHQDMHFLDACGAEGRH